MLPGFVIGLREGLETVVIVGAIIFLLRLRRQPQLLRRVWQASLLAALICVVFTVALHETESNLPPRPQQGLEAIVGAFAVAMVTYMLVWMRRFPKDLARDSREGATSAAERNSGRALIALAFFAVLREGLEIGVFVLATLGVTHASGWLAAAGVTIGVALSLVIGIGVVRGTKNVDVARFFRLTALVLVLCAAGIAMSTISHAYNAGWVTAWQHPTLDLKWLAPPGSVLASFTTGTFGIQPQPDPPEIAVWISYVAVMTTVVLWPTSLVPGEPARSSRSLHN